MRTLFTAWLIGLCFPICHCAAADERFSLIAKIVPPEKTNATLRLAIELRNTSGQPQRIATLTNLFEGRVYLRDGTGDVHEFIQTNYYNMLVTSIWMTPTVELAPDSSYLWEHSMSEFIDSHRLRTDQIGNSYPITFLTLSAEFQRGCEVWCSLGVHQEKMLNGRRLERERTATAISPIVRLQ